MIKTIIMMIVYDSVDNHGDISDDDDDNEKDNDNGIQQQPSIAMIKIDLWNYQNNILCSGFRDPECDSSYELIK